MMIRRLSEDVIGHLRTGVALTSVAQCVEELVLNSVDAGANCVAVRVDLQSLVIQVVDNGQGITKEQLPHVGERYSTSKCHSLDDLDHLRYFGYRGEALASLCSTSSFVEIITRPAGSAATYSKCFQKGRALLTEPNVPRPGTGTTVTAQNLFYNLPVRKKSLNEGLELEKTRLRLAGLALMWPLISFSLRDDVTGNVVLQTHKCNNILGTFSSLFGAARTKHMREVGAESDLFQVSGYVSRENYSKKDLQFVFINKRLVLKSKVHKLLNSVFSKSLLVRRRGERQDYSPTQGGSPTKLFERYAVYVINIECSLNTYDITFDPAKTLVEFHDWPELTSVIETMLLKFFREENLLLTKEVQGVKAGPAVSSAAGDDEDAGSDPDFCDTDDPFAGADDNVDEELGDKWQRTRLTEGISVHNNLNSLFSRTVRRCTMQEVEEGFDDLIHKSVRSSEPHRRVSTEVQSQPVQSNQCSFDWNLSKSRTCSDTSSGDSHSSETHREKTVDRMEVPDLQKRPINPLSVKGSVSKACRVERMLDKNEETALSQKAGPAERSRRQTSDMPISAEGMHVQNLSSSNVSVKEICLPQHFAHSSLSHLRSRQAGEVKTSVPLSVSSMKDRTFSQKAAGAPLKTFHQSKKIDKCSQIGVQNNSKLDDDLGLDPAEIVLPNMTRPPLLRSRSLDSGCSYYCEGDRFDDRRTSSGHRRCSDHSVSMDLMMPGILTPAGFGIRYEESNHLSNLRKNKAEGRRFITNKSDVLTSEKCFDEIISAKRMGLDKLKSNAPRIPDLRQKVVREKDEGRSAHVIDKNSGLVIREKPVCVSLKLTKAVNEAELIIDSRNEVQRGHSSAASLGEYNQTAVEVSDTDQSAAEAGDLPRHMPRQSCSSRSVSRPSRTDHTTRKPGNCDQSVSRPGNPQLLSKPGNLSQASKLARLMRKREISCPDVCFSGCKKASFDENSSCQPESSLEYPSSGQSPECTTSNLSEEGIHVQNSYTLNLFQTPQNTSSTSNCLPTVINYHAKNVPNTCLDNVHGFDASQQEEGRDQIRAHDLYSSSLCDEQNAKDIVEGATNRMSRAVYGKFPGDSYDFRVLPSCKADTVCSQRTKVLQGSWSVAAQSCNPAENTDGVCVGRDECSQQETQGFPTLSTQSFVPHLNEEGILSSDNTANASPQSKVVAQSKKDAPSPVYSMGFSPAVDSPLICDLDDESYMGIVPLTATSDKQTSCELQSLSSNIAMKTEFLSTDGLGNAVGRCPTDGTELSTSSLQTKAEILRLQKVGGHCSQTVTAEVDDHITESRKCELPADEKKSPLKRKPAVEQTENLLFVDVKKHKMSMTETSTCSLPKQSDASEPFVSSQTCIEHDVTVQKAEGSVMLSEETTGDVFSSEQNEGFSDSLPDSVLNSIVMPGTQTPKDSASHKNVSTLNCEPDKWLPTNTTPEIQSSCAMSMAEGSWNANMLDDKTPSVASEKKLSLSETTRDGNESMDDSSWRVAERTVSNFNNSVSENDGGTPVMPATQTRSSNFSQACPDSEKKACDILTQNMYTVGSVLSSASSSNGSSAHKEMLTAREANCDAEESLWTGASDARQKLWSSERQSGEDASEKSTWISVADPSTGGTVYMNSNSGHTLTPAQWNRTGHGSRTIADPGQKTHSSKHTDVEELSSESYEKLEALLSSHFESEEEKFQSKWREGSKAVLESGSTSNNTVTDMLNNWENPVFKQPDKIMQTVSVNQASHVAHSFFHPIAFTKSMLAGAKVIGQLDNKFLACLISEDRRDVPSTSTNPSGDDDEGLVVLFDQHAAHERIRLEQLMSEVYEKTSNTESGQRRIRRCDVKPPRTMDLTEEDVRLMQTFRDEYDRIGVKFEVDEERRDRVHAHTIPACMAQREANDRKRGKDPLSYQYLELLLSTAGAKQQMPQQVHRLLATHACKGAIKFGDCLTVSTSQTLLSLLSSCNLPFQCAHGRPSIAPLISLTQLRQLTSHKKCLPDLSKLRQQITAIHGADQ